MKLIVGLGNPGNIYRGSRHNIGSLVVRQLAKVSRAALKRDYATSALSARCKIEGEDVLLATPLTFMNLSGIAVGRLVKKYKIEFSSLLVICDDLDLEFGRLKIKPTGSSAGHRGLSSIINSLGSENFPRLRIGIGSNTDKDASDYVLSRFTKLQQSKIKGLLERAGACCRMWISEGVTKTMDTFNQRKLKE